MRSSGRVNAVALLALAIAGLGAVAWGVWLYITYNGTVYWNLGANSHMWYYIHPVLYTATAVIAIVAAALAARALSSPERALSPWLTCVLALLFLTTVWACFSTLLGRAYAVAPSKAVTIVGER
jgi:hypothetical protein